jgi:hypothetical protein
LANVLKGFYMEMNLIKGKPVKEIQKEFNEVYPFLKIELLAEKGKALIKELNGSLLAFNKNSIDISGNRTVADIEKEFELINLRIQIFRRAGTLWIETSLTDDWTLEQQNKEGELFSNIHANLHRK